MDRAVFEAELSQAARKAKLKLTAPIRKAILSALSERNEKAEVCRDRQGHPEPDPKLRDTENVPLLEDVETFLEREVKPHVPDAWIDTRRRDPQDGQVGLVGYDIHFNRYFYEYRPPRPLEEIEADVQQVEKEIVSVFLPFNQGRFSGAGNPPVPPNLPGFPTDYLWERIWARDSVLDLIRQFIRQVWCSASCTKPSTIRKAFQPYCETILLSKETDPNLRYDVQGRLLGFGVFGAYEIETFARVYSGSNPTLPKVHAALEPACKRFTELPPDDGCDFRSQLTGYVRLYAFLAQVVRFADTDLEKLCVSARPLWCLLQVDPEELPREIQQNIDMESFRVQRTSLGRIALERQAEPPEPASSKPGRAAVQEVEALSQIIDALNERFALNLGPEHRVALEHIRTALDNDAGLGASAQVNTRESVRLTLDPKVEDKIQEIIEANFDLYKRITDDAEFGQALKNLLFDDFMRRHRRAEGLLKLQESETLEFKSSLRWSLKGDRKDDRYVTHATLKTAAAFLNTEGGDLPIGVEDERRVLGIKRDRLESDDKCMRHLAQAVRNGLGDRAGTRIDLNAQIVEGKTICLVSCQRSPEPVYLRWEGLQKTDSGDCYVRSGPGTVRLGEEDTRKYIATKFS